MGKPSKKDSGIVAVHVANTRDVMVQSLYPARLGRSLMVGPQVGQSVGRRASDLSYQIREEAPRPVPLERPLGWPQGLLAVVSGVPTDMGVVLARYGPRAVREASHLYRAIHEVAARAASPGGHEEGGLTKVSRV